MRTGSKSIKPTWQGFEILMAMNVDGIGHIRKEICATVTVDTVAVPSGDFEV